MLTNCDAFDTFPPFPFDWLFRLGPAPGRRPGRCCRRCGRRSLRQQRLGFGWLVRRDLAADGEPAAGWRRTSPTPGVRRDVAAFARGWRPDELADVGRLAGRRSTGRCCSAGRRRTRSSSSTSAERLLATFPDATLVEFRGRAHLRLARPAGAARRRDRVGGSPAPRVTPVPIDAVIFDWGGTLTALARHRLPRRVAGAGPGGGRTPTTTSRSRRQRLHEAGATIWGRSRDHQQSSTVGRPVRRGRARARPRAAHGLLRLLGAAHLHRPGRAADLGGAARRRASRSACSPTRSGRGPSTSGSSSATASSTWSTATSTRARSRGPSRRRTRSRPRSTAVGATDPARCVYVGDRLFDDIWGAHNAGLRAIHVPHSAIPPEQVGHTEGEPDAVVHSLDEIPELVRGWA